jgi:hypothetical protein
MTLIVINNLTAAVNSTTAVLLLCGLGMLSPLHHLLRELSLTYQIDAWR